MKAKKRVRTVVNGVICAVLLLVALFPIYWLVAMAIRPTSEMTGRISLIPGALTMEHFTQLFVEKGFGQAIVNSLQTTLISTALSLVVGLCAAYIIARSRFRLRVKQPLTYWILLVRVLPPVAFTIPLYSMFSKMGLLYSKIPVVLACVLINIPLIVWFMISFFQDLPVDIEESAQIDGATEWQLFRKIVLPRSTEPQSGSCSARSCCRWWRLALRPLPCSRLCMPGMSIHTASSSCSPPPTTRCPWRWQS